MTDLTTRVAKTVGKHFVTLSCIQRPPNDAPLTALVFSGFIVDIHGEWFYVTAGHILRNLRVAIAAGSVFDTWRLDDQTAGNQFAGKAVPYAFDADTWLVLQDDTVGLDYAITHLSGYYRRQLEAGGVSAIGKKIWSDHLVPVDHWVLVGIPFESVAYDGESVICATVVVSPLKPSEAPALAGSKVDNQFYANLLEGSELVFKDANGLSGGPVFALKHVGGQWLYGVIGVQSAWYPSSRVMAICPFKSFGLALEPVVAEALREYERL